MFLIKGLIFAKIKNTNIAENTEIIEPKLSLIFGDLGFTIKF